MTEKREVLEIGWNLDNSYAKLPTIFFSKTQPTPVKSPGLMIFNDSLGKDLGLNIQEWQREEMIEILSGNQIPKGGFPLAQAYAGHQFGHFTMLGDGRAVLIGEQITPSGERFDIQLKGAGPTPYSRGGDGKATLGPMLREYIISEAMHGLGIPSTRSLALVTTGESVIRERILPGAILTRVASSHIRVGTFQYASKWGSREDLKLLADYTIKRHFPEVAGDENPYLSFLQEVIKGQASLIAKWQLVGFIHGVMNTDNISISGETIDYGPCAFMDAYDPSTVFSSIDVGGRYSYKNQPKIAAWNLARFAETLLPLLHDEEDKAIQLAQEAVAGFSHLYQYHRLNGMRGKLGLFNEETKDEGLIEDLLDIMEKHNADYTNTFRSLTLNKLEDMELFGSIEFAQWKESWQFRLARQKESKEDVLQSMKSNNPAVIPRNHRVEEALEAAEKQEDYCVMERLLDVLTSPYDYTPEKEEYTTLPPPSNPPYRTFCGT